MKTRTRILGLAILFGATLASTRAALAAPPVSPTSRELQEGQLRYKEGIALHEQKRDDEALIKFRDSYAQSGNLHALFSMARTEQLTGRLAEAMHDFREFLDAPAAEPVGRFGKETARKYVDELSKQLGLITIEAPPGAKVLLDGKSLGTEREVYALPGAHTVDGILDGRSDPHDMSVTAGSSVTVKLLQAPPPPPLAEAPAPVASAPVPVPVRQEEPKIDPGAETQRTITTGRWIAIGMGAAAVAVTGVGIGLGVNAKSADNSANASRAGNANNSCVSSSSVRCSSLQSDSSTARSEATAATGLYIGGAVLAAGAIAVWALTGPHPSRTGLVFAPSLDRTGAGFRVLGSF